MKHSGHTCSEVDHGCGACCNGIHLGMDLMFGLIHLVFAPGLGCLEQRNENPLVTKICSVLTSYQHSNHSTWTVNKGKLNLTASVPSGGRVSKSSREAWAAWTACILELMVPVRACCAEVCGHTKELSLT